MLIKVLHTEFHSLILLAEAVRSRDLVVKVHLFLIEDKNVATSDHITCWIYQVATTVDHATVLIVQLAVCCLEDNCIAALIELELSKDFLYRKVWHLRLSTLRQLFSLSLGLSWLGRWLR